MASRSLDGGIVERAGPVLLEQPGEGAVREQSAAGLAGGAIVDFVLRVPDALDRRAAHGTGLPEATVDRHAFAERRDLLRERVAGVDLEPLDPRRQGLARRAPQSLDLVGAELRGNAQRREPRRVEDLVRIGVADAVEQVRVGERALQGMRLARG